MEGEDCAAKKQPTIPSIDDSISRLNGRLYNLLEDLKSATHGEQPECVAKEDAESPMPSASIESISKRLDDAHSIVEIMENFMKRFHS